MAQLVHTRICIGSGKERKGCLEERKIRSSVFVDCTCPAASTTTGSVTYGMKSSGRVFGNGANVEAARTGARSKAARDTDSISKNFLSKNKFKLIMIIHDDHRFSNYSTSSSFQCFVRHVIASCALRRNLWKPCTLAVDEGLAYRCSCPRCCVSRRVAGRLLY